MTLGSRDSMSPHAAAVASFNKGGYHYKIGEHWPLVRMTQRASHSMIFLVTKGCEVVTTLVYAMRDALLPTRPRNSTSTPSRRGERKIDPLNKMQWVGTGLLTVIMQTLAPNRTRGSGFVP